MRMVIYDYLGIYAYSYVASLLFLPELFENSVEFHV